MPIYEYACSACGHTFEEWQKMSDPPVRTCPKCKKKKVDKLISQTAFQLKGGGWYADLYSSSKPGGKDGGKDGDGGGAAKEGGATGKGKETKDGSSSDSGGAAGKGADSGAAPSKKDVGKDAKKKDTAKKSEARAV